MTDSHDRHDQGDTCTRVGLHNCGGQWRNHDRWPFHGQQHTVPASMLQQADFDTGPELAERGARAGQQHDQGDTLRAAQIAAVRKVMRWDDDDLDADERATLGTLAADLVDAVSAAGEPEPAAVTQAVADAVQRIVNALGEDGAADLLLAAAEHRDDQAHAAGYGAAVANLRGVVQRTGSPAARWAADYLEAIGPGAAPAQPEPTWRVGRHLGRTLYHHGQVVGMVDSPELAARIVEALDAAEEANPSTRVTFNGHDITDMLAQPVEDLRRPYFYREPANGVQLAVTYQGGGGIAFVAQPHRDAGQPYEQYGVVLPWDVVLPLARRILASAPESGQDRSTHPDLPDEGRTGRDGETAGRDEAVCICPQIETTTFADLEARERTFVRGKPNPNCPVCPDATERTTP